MANRYDGFQIGVAADPDADYALAYEFDTMGRVQAVNDPNDTFTYDYVTNAPHLIDTMTGPLHTAKRVYEPYRDHLQSLTNTETDGTPSVISRYAYQVNALGQRTDIVRDGSAFAVGTGASGNHFDHIQYNGSGEVDASDRYAGTNPAVLTSPVTGHDYDWVFDGLGNRDTATKNSATTDYTATQVNQYSSITRPGASAYAPVSDDDGNLTQDADWDYVWDAENRLISRTPRTATTGKIRQTYKYDYRGRRVEIYSEYYTGSAWAHYHTERMLYDGWNPVMHYSYAPPSTQGWQNRSYTWGIDVSGSLQGAGGVGGLLSVTGWLARDNPNYLTLRYYYTFDGNGNVSEIINKNLYNGYRLCAHHEYDAFGNLTGMTDNGGWSIGHTNPFRFSTKWQDIINTSEESGAVSACMAPGKLYYYGYRFYDPVDGRWLSRDPIAEQGGLNLYGMVGNDPVNDSDVLGLAASVISNATDLPAGDQSHTSAGDLLFKLKVKSTGRCDCLKRLDIGGHGNPWGMYLGPMNSAAGTLNPQQSNGADGDNWLSDANVEWFAEYKWTGHLLKGRYALK